MKDGIPFRKPLSPARRLNSRPPTDLTRPALLATPDASGGDHGLCSCRFARNTRTALAVVFALLCGVPCLAADDALTTLRQLRELSPARADQHLPITVEGVVTFVDAPRYMTFLQDDTAGIYLQAEIPLQLEAGQRVRVVGTSRAGRFTPFLSTTNVTVLGTHPLPPARRLEMAPFKAGFVEGARVALEGRVLAAALIGDRARLKLARAGEVAQVWLNHPERLNPESVVRAEVRISGICAGVFNEQNEVTDFHLHAADPAAIEILAPPSEPAQLPDAHAIKALESGWQEAGHDQVRCRGRVTLHWPGRHLFITDGSGNLEIRTEDEILLNPGDEVEAVGLRAVAHRRMILTEASVKKLGPGERPRSVRTRLDTIQSRHSHGDLIEIDAELLERPALPEQDGSPGDGTPGRILILRQQNALLRAELAAGIPVAEIDSLPLHSRVRLAGVLVAQAAGPGEALSYRLLVDDPAALVVLQRAPWWTVQRALVGLGIAGTALLSGAGWAVGLNQRRRRKAEQAVRRQREKAMRHQAALLELTRLVQTPRAQDIFSRITEIVAGTLGVARASIWRLDEDESTLVCQDLFADGTHRSGDRLEKASVPGYFAALHEHPIIVAEDALSDPRTREFAKDYLLPNQIAALLDVPLRFHGRPSGVLCLEHTGQPRTWAVEDQNFATAVADQLTILREAGERLRAEEALREAHTELEVRVVLRTTELAEARDRAEAADRLKSAFLATMSHELRTPLNSIIGFTGILFQGLVGPLLPEQKKQLGMVQNSARHLLSLINDVLDISKIEAGQIEVSLEPFDVAEAIGRVTDLVRPLAEKKKIPLSISIPPDLGTWTSDRRRVEQILINLLNNAIKFTDHGEVRLECARTPDALQFRVSDTGIGIRAEDLPQLFKPFRQLDTGLARQHEGTGLGLAICAGFAKLLQGTIQVTSEPRRGSTFTLTLPRGASQT